VKRAVIIFALLAAASGAAADTATVGFRKSLTISVTGALAAFPVDGNCVDAKAKDETVTIYGKKPGKTNVVVVTTTGTETIEVIVSPPVPSYPRDFVPPDAPAGSAQGSYEVRYSSEPAQILSQLDFTRRQGDLVTRLHVSNANLLSDISGRSTASLPSLSYQIITPGREIALFDRDTVVSPLTVSGSAVRGIHILKGPFELHAGYTSVATFQNLFLPTQRETVWGGGYRFALGKSSSITPSLYFFSGAPLGSRGGREGAVGSLLYQYRPTDQFHLLAELGVSRGVGAAIQIVYDRPGQQLRGRLRYSPPDFAGLTVNNLRGFFSDFSWKRALTSRWTSTLAFAENRYLLPGLNQTNLTSSLQLNYKIDRNWGLFGGVSYARFSASQPVRPTVENYSLPVGFSFDSKHFGNNFQYQFARNSGSNLGGHQFRDSLRVNLSQWRFTAFVDRQTQAPTVDFIFRQTPGLEEAFTQLGLAATSSQQIALLLRDNAALAALGYIEGVTVHLSPVRLQSGGSLSWAGQGRSRQAFQYNFLYNSTQGITSGLQTAIQTATFSRRLTESTDLFVSFSLFRTRLPGRESAFKPLVEFSLRRRLGGAPGFFLPRRHGMITGVVFEDVDSDGRMQHGDNPIPNVEIVLDGKQRTRTDAQGRYTFPRVTMGTHEVEILFAPAKAFYFTTPSRVETDVNAQVNFGVGFSLSHLFGTIRNDAGLAVAGVEIIVARDGQTYRARSNGDGKYKISGLTSGEYSVSIEADSIPAGYRIDNLVPVHSVVEAGIPAEIGFTLTAVRSLSGKVTIYDTGQTQNVPAAGVRVFLRELARESVTDAGGVFLFRNLPAGEFTLAVVYLGKETTRRVVIPAGPAFIKDANIDLGALDLSSK